MDEEPDVNRLYFNPFFHCPSNFLRDIGTPRIGPHVVSPHRIFIVKVVGTSLCGNRAQSERWNDWCWKQTLDSSWLEVVTLEDAHCIGANVDIIG